MRRICLLLTSILLIMTMLTACSKPIDRLSATELLDLGEKYLLEMNYEQAVVQFLKVIEIEPKNPRGYTGAAEAYVGLGQIDKAIEILEQGFKLTGDSSIQNMIKRLQIKPIAQEIEASVNVIKTELRSGNYPAAIAEVHSGTMLSFLRGQEDGSYFYKEEIWDESK
ncbi:MAG: tetratricopeptide repeat protein, partial [Ruminiclostridium sp.]|nr:tetratricopeptide repeat protein [Ruminiclostridium sp.]